MVSIYCDGGARGNPGKAASAFVVKNEEGKVIYEEGKYIGIATNNVAEYSAVFFALTWLLQMSRSNPPAGGQITNVNIFLDSELVARQLRGEYKIKNKNLMEYVFKIKKLEKEIGREINYKNIPRSQNALADHLVNETLDLQK